MTISDHGYLRQEAGMRLEFSQFIWWREVQTRENSFANRISSFSTINSYYDAYVWNS